MPSSSSFVQARTHIIVYDCKRRVKCRSKGRVRISLVRPTMAWSTVLQCLNYPFQIAGPWNITHLVASEVHFYIKALCNLIYTLRQIFPHREFIYVQSPWKEHLPFRWSKREAENGVYAWNIDKLTIKEQRNEILWVCIHSCMYLN